MTTQRRGPLVGQYNFTKLVPDGININDCPWPNCWTRTQNGAQGMTDHLRVVHQGLTPWSPPLI